jgi:hypothetical protein
MDFNLDHGYRTPTLHEQTTTVENHGKQMLLEADYLARMNNLAFGTTVRILALAKREGRAPMVRMPG